ncbi:hypothetical protein NC653_003549 [Populus alba x Populus x berolinensis]|uniref:Uncharacterized protein n=1 Tax=Populus alba x Populus x berolinensis TaxID=444605 RepID=A0AAD6RSM7_9ROSI|nr:hypothetical protein NC653_003549 [Populus alba x Populus x berolinensis]
MPCSNTSQNNTSFYISLTSLHHMSSMASVLRVSTTLCNLTLTVLTRAVSFTKDSGSHEPNHRRKQERLTNADENDLGKVE